MSERITDLEKFALQHIMRPYWPLLDNTGSRYPRLTHSLDEVARLLDTGPIEWRTPVFDRLWRIGIWFPDYIEHKLVHVVQAGMNRAAANAAKPSEESL